MKSLDKIIDYRELLERSTKGFVGRRWVQQAIDEFLKRPSPRQFLILGEPGSGKTAFLADLVRQRGYPHHFIGKGSLTGLVSSQDWRDPIRFAESIGYQLLRDYGGWIMRWDDWGIHVDQKVQDLEGLLMGAKVGTFKAAPRPEDRPTLSVKQEVERFGTAAQMIGVYIEKFVMDPEQVIRQLLVTPLKSIAKRWPRRKVVLVVDGLDEANAYSNPAHNIFKLLPSGDLPKNVRFLLSSRPGEHLTDSFLAQTKPFWLSEDPKGKLNPHAEEDAVEFVRGLAQEPGVEALLRQHQPQIKPDAFVQAVASASEGNFLYLYHYAQGLRGGDKTLLDLKSVPIGIYGIYRDFLAKVKESRDPGLSWNQMYKPVLGTLAVARAPLSLSQIAQIAGVDREVVGTILAQVEPYLDTSKMDQKTFYAFYHPSFGEYLISDENDDIIDAEKAHMRVVVCYRGKAKTWEKIQWGQVDDYGLRYLPIHLTESGQLVQLSALLLHYPWLQAKLERTGMDVLLADFGLLPGDVGLKQVVSALALSAHVLTSDKTQLAGQLVGRLARLTDPGIQALIAGARRWTGAPWLCPITPSLSPPGGPLLRTLKGRLGGHSGTVRSVAIDGRWAITAGNSTNDQTVRIWNLETGECRHTLRDQASPGGLTRLALSAASDRAVTSYGDELRVWKLEEGDLLHTFPGRGKELAALALALEGTQALTGTADGEVCVRDLEALTVVDLPGHPEPVHAVAITPDGRWGVSASESMLKVWNLEKRQMHNLLKTSSRLHGGRTDSQLLTLSSDGREVVFGDPPRRWNLANGTVVELLNSAPPGRTLAFTPDSRRALISVNTENTKLAIWDLPSHSEHLRLPDQHTISTLAISPDGARAVTADFDHDLFVWDLLNPLLQLREEAHDEELQFVSFAAEGHTAFFRTPTGRLQSRMLDRDGLLRSRGRQAVQSAENPDDAQRRSALKEQIQPELKKGHHPLSRPILVVTENGNRAVSAFRSTAKKGDYEEPVSANSNDTFQEITLWKQQGDKLIKTILRGHTAPVQALDMTPDGRWAISSGYGRIIRIWDLEATAQRWAIRGHQGIVSSVCISRDGRRAASASEDSTVKIWNLESGQLIATFTSDSWMMHCWISADGEAVVAREQTGPDVDRFHILRLCGVG